MRGEDGWHLPYPMRDYFALPPTPNTAMGHRGIWPKTVGMCGDTHHWSPGSWTANSTDIDKAAALSEINSSRIEELSEKTVDKYTVVGNKDWCAKGWHANIWIRPIWNKKMSGRWWSHKHQFHQSRLGGKPQTSKKTTGRNPLSRTRVAASKGSQVMIRAAGWYVQDFHSWQQMVRGKSEKQWLGQKHF